MEHAQKVCLCMIVKNEAKVIARCLESVIPFIDRWVIVDTGSNDNTQEIIKDIMYKANIPGTLYERTWIDFSTNRNQALNLAREESIDYIFVIDADEVLRLPEGYNRPNLSLAGYNVLLNYGNIVYPRMSVVDANKSWKYYGAVHEVLTLGDGRFVPFGQLDNVTIEVCLDEPDQPEKYLQHAEILKKEAEKEQFQNPRTIFYLAQSYRNAGLSDIAYNWYERRIKMKGNIEEIFYSYLQLAKLSVVIQKTQEDILAWCLKAYNCIPARAAESLGFLAMYLRKAEVPHLAILFSEKAINCPMPRAGLFVDRDWYEWKAKLQHFSICKMMGDPRTATKLQQELLLNSALPEKIKYLVSDSF